MIANVKSTGGVSEDDDTSSQAPTGRSLRKNLALSLADASSFSLMVGLGETYLPPYVLALGLGELAAGLIATLPMVAGALLQLVSPYAVRAFRSHRRWVVLCASLQAASFLPIISLAFIRSIPPQFVFLAAAAYWAGGLGTSPAWNTWICNLVPARLRSTFFARRFRFAQAAMFLGFVLGGITLQLSKGSQFHLMAFGAIFLLAGTCRGCSAICLALHSEPIVDENRFRHVSTREWFGQLRRGRGGRLLAYLMAVQASVWISGPYFGPFMLKQLQFSYLTFVLLMAGGYVAKIVSLPWLGRIARTHGAHWVLWIGGVGIVPVSGLWLLSNSIGYLLILQILGGVVWAAYELAMSLMFFEAIPQAERTSVLTKFNLANSVATVTGSLIGWSLLMALGVTKESYLVIFVVSSIARGLAVILLSRVPNGNVDTGNARPATSDTISSGSPVTCEDPAGAIVSAVGEEEHAPAAVAEIAAS